MPEPRTLEDVVLAELADPIRRAHHKVVARRIVTAVLDAVFEADKVESAIEEVNSRYRIGHVDAYLPPGGGRMVAAFLRGDWS